MSRGRQLSSHVVHVEHVIFERQRPRLQPREIEHVVQLSKQQNHPQRRP
jgi:hypothetical protein